MQQRLLDRQADKESDKRRHHEGFEMVDVWESKEDFDKFGEEVVGPAMARAGIDTSGPQPEMTEFEPVGLMLGKR